MAKGDKNPEEESDDDSGFRDPRMVNESFVKFKIAEYACFYFGMVGVCCGIIEYEISYNDDTQKTRQITLLTIGLFCSLCLLISIVVRYNLMLKWQKTRGLLGKHDTLGNTGYWQNMLIEMLVSCIQPFPFLWNIKYSEGYSDYDTTV